MNSPALHEFELLSRFKALWREHLAAYLDGAAHTLGGATHTFPAATIAFDQGSATQPMQGCEVRVVVTPDGGWTAWQGGEDDTVRRAECTVGVMHFIRCRLAAGDGASNDLATRVADALHAILSNPTATEPLAARGVQALRPEPPSTLNDPKYMSRMLVCSARLVFPVQI